MVARLKLKGIDGRAPPGVNNCLRRASAPKSRLPVKLGRVKIWVNSHRLVTAVFLSHRYS